MMQESQYHRARNVQIAPRNGSSEAEVLLDEFETQASGYDRGEDLRSRGLGDYWRLVHRHRGAMVLSTSLGLLIGFFYAVSQDQIYQASALVEIQPMNPDFLNMRDVNPVEQAEGGRSGDALETQIKIMQTRALIDRVQKRLNDVKPGLASSQADPISGWRQALGLQQLDPTTAWEQASAMAANSVRVRVVARTRTVQVTVDSTDPTIAADFANTLAEEFINQNLEARSVMTQRTGKWLSDQLEHMQITLKEAEAKLQDYSRRSGLLYVSGESDIGENRLQQLEQSLSTAQADRGLKQWRFELTGQSDPGSLPGASNDSSLSEYESKLTDLRRQELELRTTLGKGHDKVRKVHAQIEALETALVGERESIVRRIRNEYNEAVRREALLRQEYEAQARIIAEHAEKAVQFNMLKREVESTRELHDGMLQRVKEASVASALRASNVRVVDPARVPSSPFQPRLRPNLLAGLMFGALCGIGFVVLRDRANRTFQNPGDITYYLNTRELGVIPATERKRAFKFRYRARTDRSAFDLRLGQCKSGRAELACLHHNPSMIAESFRATLTSILFSGPNGARPRILTVTSSCPCEGKTTVTCNLAIALAHLNKRVLLIDADLRRPRMHEIFEVSQAVGLSDLLSARRLLGQEPLDPWIRQVSIENLVILPSGSAEQSVPAAHLLFSQQMADLLERSRNMFDMVLIDSPSMLQIPDARILGRLSDAVILVVRAGKTTRDTALAAQQMFDEDGTRVLGSVLNRWDAKTTRTGAYGYSSNEGHYRNSSNGATSSGNS